MDEQQNQPDLIACIAPVIFELARLEQAHRH